MKICRDAILCVFGRWKYKEICRDAILCVFGDHGPETQSIVSLQLFHIFAQIPDQYHVANKRIVYLSN
jgi:hypothetical protein